MVAVVTIPRGLTKQGDLILVARSEYEKLLRLAGKKNKIDVGLRESLSQARRGEVVGPFTTSKDLMKSLAL